MPFGCPAGVARCTYSSFPLKITGNHTELSIASAATLKFSTVGAGRNATTDSRSKWHGVPAALSGAGITDVVVSGGGTIDGSGELWWTECAGHSLNSSGWSSHGQVYH